MLAQPGFKILAQPGFKIPLWESTDTSGQKMNLQGVWSALFVREGECWKIKMRHESFIHLKEQSD